MYSFLFYLELMPLQSQFLSWHPEQPKMKKLQSNTSFFVPYCVLKQVWSTIGHKKNEPCRTRFSFCFAEREGFEPPEPLSSTVFKTAAIDHSAISPTRSKYAFFQNRLQRYYKKCIYANFLKKKCVFEQKKCAYAVFG